MAVTVDGAVRIDARKEPEIAIDLEDRNAVENLFRGQDQPDIHQPVPFAKPDPVPAQQLAGLALDDSAVDEIDLPGGRPAPYIRWR